MSARSFDDQPPKTTHATLTIDFFGRPPDPARSDGLGGDTEGQLRREIADLRDLCGKQGRALEAVDTILTKLVGPRDLNRSGVSGDFLA